MKSGFHADMALESEPIQRADRNIPLNSFGVPGVDWESIRRAFQLPNQYLRTCTLKEGTVITMIIYQTMSLAVVAFLLVMILIFPKQTHYWWKEKFRNDLDYYYQGENEDLQKRLRPLVEPMTYAVIGVHGLFFLTGCIVIFALLRKHAHPLWYMPWILVSTTLSIIHWLMCGTMIIVTFILAFYRDISVTWDIVPILCTIVYGVGYVFFCMTN
ncbi:unnamed protein product [Orchesella dallaii]|uniref:Transmembrane protein n=1 Tax=Orchesella dallaii TaxID=48710 RepID=A0ABP1QR29_9HEXA